MKKLTVLLLVLIVLLQFRLWFGDGNIRELHRLSDRIEELRQDGAKRRERNAALEAEVMDLKQGTDAIEERARQDLGMTKEGEDFVQVIEHRQPETRHRPSTTTRESEKKSGRESASKRRPHREQRPGQAEPIPAPPTEAPVEPSNR